MTLVLAVFLGLHGLVHLAVWLPKPAADEPPPFDPDHSALLAATRTPARQMHRLANGLAVGCAGGYLLTALAVALGSDGAVPVAIASALVGLALKVLFFHPWLSLGVLLDVGVLLSAGWGWPVNLP